MTSPRTTIRDSGVSVREVPFSSTRTAQLVTDRVGAGQRVLSQPALQTQAAGKLTKQREPRVCRQHLFRRFELERKHRLRQSPYRPVSFLHQIGDRLHQLRSI
jgi:hypothetical protein